MKLGYVPWLQLKILGTKSLYEIKTGGNYKVFDMKPIIHQNSSFITITAR